VDMGAAADDVREGFGRIMAAAGALRDQLIEKLGQMLSWVGEQVPVLVDTLAGWGRSFVEFIGPAIPPMFDALMDMRAQVLNWIIAQVGPLIEKLGRWAEQFTAWIGPMIPVALKELGRMASKTLDWLIATAPLLAEKFLSEWAPAAVVWIAKAAATLLVELPSILTTIGTWIITEGVPKLIELTVKLGEAIVRGIINGIKNLGGQIWDAVKGFLPGGGGEAQQHTKVTIQSARQYIESPEQFRRKLAAEHMDKVFGPDRQVRTQRVDLGGALLGAEGATYTQAGINAARDAATVVQQAGRIAEQAMRASQAAGNAMTLATMRRQDQNNALLSSILGVGFQSQATLRTSRDDSGDGPESNIERRLRAIENGSERGPGGMSYEQFMQLMSAMRINVDGRDLGTVVAPHVSNLINERAATQASMGGF
jgi:phage-related protein